MSDLVGFDALFQLSGRRLKGAGSSGTCGAPEGASKGLVERGLGYSWSIALLWVFTVAQQHVERLKPWCIPQQEKALSSVLLTRPSLLAGTLVKSANAACSASAGAGSARLEALWTTWRYRFRVDWLPLAQGEGGLYFLSAPTGRRAATPCTARCRRGSRRAGDEVRQRAVIRRAEREDQ